MRIALFANRDVHANAAVNALAGLLERHEVSLYLSDGVGRTPDVRELALLRLVEQDVPNAHVLPHAAPGAELASFEGLGRALGASVEVANAPNAEPFLAKMRALAPDVVVSIRYGRIFRDAFLAIPERGVLNLHSGLLPDYRGVLATFWALAGGAEEVGCTLHAIEDATIDTGSIVDELRIPVNPERSLFGHVHALYRPGAGLLERALASLAAGEALARRAQPEGGRYFSYPTAADFARLAARGFRLFDASEIRELYARYRSPST